MVLVLVQVGLLVRDHILVVHAIREAARAAAVDPTTEAATSAARAATTLDPARMQIETSGGRTTGGLLRVTVRYRPEPAVPIVGRFFPSMVLEEALTVRVE